LRDNEFNEEKDGQDSIIVHFFSDVAATSREPH